MTGHWRLSSSSDRAALDIVDGTGLFAGSGPHYSRRTPGSRTFTGVGREVVLVSDSAVWAVVLQKTPARRGSGASRGREAQADGGVTWVWRNNVFRNLGPALSSELIREATERTYTEWLIRYGALPPVRLRTEIGVARIRSTNPGCCYQKAGWQRGPVRRGVMFWFAPVRA